MSDNNDELYEGFDDSDAEYLKNLVNQKENNVQTDHIEESNFNFQNDKNKYEFEAIDISELPAGRFYQDGTKILVRAAKVHEIQAYSVVDNTNPYDISEKMSDMLKSCVKVILPSGKIGSYANLKVADRTYLIFYIRERTFQKGNTLKMDCECDNCGNSYETSMLRKYFKNGEMNTDYEKYFDTTTKMFTFQLNNGENIRIGLPTIGMERSLYEHVKSVVRDKKKPNMAFVKYDPFLCPNRSKITDEGIKKRLKDFINMDEETFLFIEGFISEMEKDYGIKSIVTNCEQCEAEVHSDMRFPGGASTIFTVSDRFDQFIKK